MMTAHTQSKRLDRKKFFGDPLMVSTIGVLLIFLALFILYPLATLLVDSIRDPESGGLSLSVFNRVLSMSRFQAAFNNTLVLGFLTGIASTLIGLLFAYVDVYMKVRSRVVK